MTLASTRHIPKVWAAAVRVMTVAGSLSPYERGALAPARQVSLTKPESNWLGRLSEQAESLPEDEEAFVASMATTADPAKVRLDQYGIGS